MNNEAIKLFFQKYGMQIVVQVLSVIIGILVAYFGIKQDVALITQKQEAQAAEITKDELLIPQFYAVQQAVIDENNKLSDIQKQLDEITNHLLK